jgi:beta-glucosidase-like glycosyl hydrolase/CubicO group peptidase (beta-lactamase class C family)
LTLEAKAAQLIAVRAEGLYDSPASPKASQLRILVQELGVGTLVVFESEVESLPRRLNALQGSSRLPLLVAADMERGMAFRIPRGVVPLPFAMAIGATGSEAAARFSGEIAAREGRALGVHWAFAPVADVNNNPANPVINIRSFGEDPERVGLLVSAFIRGAHAGGLMTTAKHFPGHGNTAVDSHLALPTIDGDEKRLEVVELRPFRRALAAGVDAVMLGHIAAPGLDPSGVPATMSGRMVTGLLRGRLGFDGLVVTDALEMAGIGDQWTGGAAVGAVQAGADLVLLPPDPRVAVQSLVRAVREGQLTEARLDESVARVLKAKEGLGLHEQRFVDGDALAESVGRTADIQEALNVARASVTLVKNEAGVLPLHAERAPRLLHLLLTSDVRDRDIRGILEEELALRGGEVHHEILGPEVSHVTAREIAQTVGDYSHVLISAFARVRGGKGTVDMSPTLAGLVEDIAAGSVPVVVVSLGSPYLLRQFPDVDAYVCTYGAAESSQRAAIGAVLGEFPLRGRLPVTLPGLFAAGHGIQLERHEMTLGTSSGEDVGFKPGAMLAVDESMEKFIAGRVFPGAVVAVGRASKLVHLKAYGQLSYGLGAPPVRVDTLYDLASLTKVLATTAVAMILVDKGELDLDRPVSAYLPLFRGGARDGVTVRQLLSHSSGLDWWAPLYETLRGSRAYVEAIERMELVYKPGSRSLYSDLGVILLGEILERVTGETLDRFVQRKVFDPVGMSETGYLPEKQLWPRIAPTEEDAWRGRLLRGEVHDENAYAMGGVAPHAGLFGTAVDVARFAQMMLNGGVYDHKRIVRQATVQEFTRLAGVPGSTRALGWDTPSARSSSAGELFSRSSYGHTGFTGTSLWIDPERELFLVILTNRVHPTRASHGIADARAAIANAVVGGLAEETLPRALAP